MRRIFFLTLTITMSAFVFSITAAAQQRFTAVLTGAQEVPANGSAGKGFCSVVLNSTETQMTVNCTYTDMSTAVTASHIHDNGPVGVSGPVRFNFAFSGGTSGTIGPLTFAPTPAQIADLRAKKWYANIHTTALPGGEIRGQVKPSNTIYDADGDGRTDIVVFRQSNNTFYTLNSVNNTITPNQFGSGSGDNWLNNTADFDGDGRGDPLLLKLDASGAAYWSVLQTGSNSIKTVQFGSFAASQASSLAPGDYDGDGKEDIATFSRASGFWYILESSTNTTRVVQNFGAVNDFPSVGDFDKDGKTDLNVVRNEGGQYVWYTQLSSTGLSTRVPWGSATTDGVFFFAQVDVDGDGAQDKMTTRTVSGATQFNILRSSDGGQVYLTWGASTDAKLFGDYDGDGKTDIVARRSANGVLVWYILLSSTNYDTAQGRAVTFGATGDQ